MRHVSTFGAAVFAFIAATAFSVGIGFAGEAHTTSKFEGVKANTGTATHSRDGGKDMLTWSSDFTIPDTPAPHWQVIDSKGNVYLLQRLVIKGDKQNRSIVLPAYVKDVAKVQIWCAWAEALLGEASFSKAIKTAAGEQDNMMASR
jgi:hypothetical protein